MEKQHFVSWLLLNLIEENNYFKEYDVFLKCT